MLSGGSLGLLLRPTKLTKSSKVSVEAIDKIAVVRLSNGTLENRSLRQLSGGERRRLALALALGYADFVSQKGGLQCNLLVLDEVLQVSSPTYPLFICLCNVVCWRLLTDIQTTLVTRW
jgi:ABC-type glutathione transport system ATPase component